MANHPSAIKRHKQSLKRRDANREVKSHIRTLVRRVNEAVEAGDAETANASLKNAARELARASSKGVLHTANASRRTGRLARKVAKLDASTGQPG